ncbi:MAG: hypothetical protein RPR97_18660 [Colwellia sp.]|jgi:hypothetical protein
MKELFCGLKVTDLYHGWWKLLVFSILYFNSFYVSAVGKVCLEFYEGVGNNHVAEFLIKKGVSEKQIKFGRSYSSSYDLNGDGHPEFFYFLEIPILCGRQTGCYLSAYEYKDGDFRELIKYGMPTQSNFNPRNENHKNYICILEGSEGSEGDWKQLRVKEKYNMSYNGKYYKAIVK